MVWPWIKVWIYAVKRYEDSRARVGLYHDHLYLRISNCVLQLLVLIQLKYSAVVTVMGF